MKKSPGINIRSSFPKTLPIVPKLQLGNDTSAFLKALILLLLFIALAATKAESSVNLIGAYDQTGSAYDDYVSGNYAYVADKEAGLEIIDVSTPASPSLAGSYDSPAGAKSVYVSGIYTYVSNYNSELLILEFTGASADTPPSITGTPTLDGNPYTSTTATYTKGQPIKAAWTFSDPDSGDYLKDYNGLYVYYGTDSDMNGNSESLAWSYGGGSATWIVPGLATANLGTSSLRFGIVIQDKDGVGSCFDVSGNQNAAALCGYFPTDFALSDPSTAASVPNARFTGTFPTTGDGSWTALTSGTTAYLVAGDCPSESVCYAAGENGTILKTTNGGASWTAQTSGVTTDLNSLRCTDANTCYAAGSDWYASGGGIIIKTTNGGTTWIQSASYPNESIMGLSCPASNTCYVVRAFPSSALNTILKTTDGGSTWTEQTPSAQVIRVYCIDASTCYAPGTSGAMLKTTDGGGTWSALTTETTYYLEDISCPAASVCFAVGNNLWSGASTTSNIVLKTTDGGTTWTTMNTGTSNVLYGIYCTDANKCYVAASDNGTILYTSNAGASWTVQYPGVLDMIVGIDCPSSSVCFASGYKGMILKRGAAADTTPPAITMSSPSDLPSTIYIQSQEISIGYNVVLDDALSMPAGLTQLKFYYLNDAGLSAVPTPITLLASIDSSGNVTATIPGTDVVPGTNIYFGIIATDSNGKKGAYPTGLDISSVANFIASASTVPGENIHTLVSVDIPVTPGAWNQISMPLTLNSATLANILNKSLFDVYVWDPRVASDPVYHNFRRPTTLSAGQGLWIYPKTGAGSITVSGAEPGTSEYILVPISPGWNQIGTPRDQDYNWNNICFADGATQVHTYPLDAIVAAGKIARYPFYYDTSGNAWHMLSEAEPLTSGVGYMVYSYTASGSLHFYNWSMSAFASSRRALVVERPDNFLIKISATGASSSDPDNFVGLAAESANRFDGEDIFEPPAAFGKYYTSLYFPHDNWPKNAGRYARDFRPISGVDSECETKPASGICKVWDFNVASNESGTRMTISWGALSAYAGTYEVTLTDLSTGAQTDMTAAAGYSYTTNGAARSFRLTAVMKGDGVQTLRHTLHAGWNLVSVPLEPLVTDAASVLGDDLNPLEAIQYYSGKYYTTRDTEGVDIQAGIGYWVHAAAATEIDVTGIQPTAETGVTAPLKQGWNPIGNPFAADLSWGDNIGLTCGGATKTLSAATAAGWTDGAAWRYEADGSYSKIAPGGTLAPWEGYWLNVSRDCDIVLK
jgi:photosystem II stability/assembly factor-like uncharacterized protein